MSLPEHSSLTQTALSPCVIYCRVSSRKQLIEGDGLKGQERNCRTYAEQRGYTVLRVFTDGITGSSQSREGLGEMLTFLKATSRAAGREVVVIVDDIKRFARDVTVHFDLKLAIYASGGRLESPLFRFEDSPEGKFIETIVAAQAELERNQNRRQVRSRMQARLEQGYWAFNPPAGYTYRQNRVHKKILTPEHPNANLIAAALEQFASGHLCGTMDIWRFLATEGFFGEQPGRLARSRQLRVIHDMLRQVLYTGHLEYKPWGVHLRPAQHEALISLATFEKIQARLNGSDTPVLRGTVSTEFPLRGLILCAQCQRPLTASLSRSATGKRYPYYHCGYPRCKLHGATIQKAVIEQDFTGILASLTAADETMAVLRTHLVLHAEQTTREGSTHQARLRTELASVQVEMDRVAERFGRTTSAAAARILERRIEELDHKRLMLVEATERKTQHTTATDVGTLFDAVAGILQNPLHIWQTGTVEARKMITRITFATPPVYQRNVGLGTPNLSLPYRFSRHFAEPNYHMVDPGDDAWEQLLCTLGEWDDEWSKLGVLEEIEI